MDVDEVLRAAALTAATAGETALLRELVADLAARPRRSTAATIGGALERGVARAWSRGWQPVDLARLGDRRVGERAARLLRTAIASQSASYEHLGRLVAPDWMAQLAAIGALRDWDPGCPYLVQLRCEWRDAVAAAVHVHGMLERPPHLPCLVAPPAEWRVGDARRESSLPHALLDKVRALLAKAESTTFEAEAEAFTAKAQELMARHRIDRALLDASSGRHEDAVGHRIWIDNPYASAKYVLLSEIAGANGCRAILSKAIGFATVFGVRDDLEAVEELFTSLLVQATAALRRSGSKQDADGQSRTARFRRSFLLAFAYRIGERLHEAVDTTVAAAAAETGTELVPLLRARSEAADVAVEATFDSSTLRAMRTSITDGEGWTAGRVFADQADLSVAVPIARESA